MTKVCKNKMRLILRKIHYLFGNGFIPRKNNVFSGSIWKNVFVSMSQQILNVSFQDETIYDVACIFSGDLPKDGTIQHGWHQVSTKSFVQKEVLLRSDTLILLRHGQNCWRSKIRAWSPLCSFNISSSRAVLVPTQQHQFVSHQHFSADKYQQTHRCQSKKGPKCVCVSPILM